MKLVNFLNVNKGCVSVLVFLSGSGKEIKNRSRAGIFLLHLGSCEAVTGIQFTVFL